MTPDRVARREVTLLTLVVAVGVALRLVASLTFAAVEPFGDQMAYLDGALEIVRGAPYSGTRGPAYSGFLAGLARIGADSAFLLRLGNVALGALSIAGVWALGRELFSSRVGLIAATGLALHPRWWSFSPYFFSEQLFVPCVVLGTWLVARSARTGSRWAGVAAGAWLGLGCLTREMLLFFVPVAAVALVWSGSGSLRLRGARALLLIVAAAAVIAPWTYRNQRVYERFLPIGFSSGIPLYEGNVEAPNEYAVRQRRNQLYTRFKDVGDGSYLDVDDRFRARARRIIAGRQPAWIFEKLASNGPLLFQPDITRPEPWWSFGPERRDAARRWSSVVFLVAHAATLLLGVVGLAHWSLRRTEVVPLAFLGFSLAAHVVANAGISRFQLAYEWVLVLAAAVVVERRWPATVLRRRLAIALLALLCVSQWPVAGRWTAPYRDAGSYRLRRPGSLDDARPHSSSEPAAALAGESPPSSK